MCVEVVQTGLTYKCSVLYCVLWWQVLQSPLDRVKQVALQRLRELVKLKTEKQCILLK